MLPLRTQPSFPEFETDTHGARFGKEVVDLSEVNLLMRIVSSYGTLTRTFIHSFLAAPCSKENLHCFDERYETRSCQHRTKRRRKLPSGTLLLPANAFIPTLSVAAMIIVSISQSLLGSPYRGTLSFKNRRTQNANLESREARST